MPDEEIIDQDTKICKQTMSELIERMTPDEKEQFNLMQRYPSMYPDKYDE